MGIDSGTGMVTQLEDGIFLLSGGRSGCNVFIVRGTRKTVMIDTGLPGDYEVLCAGLAEIGLSFEDIHVCILTHEHIDHLGCAARLPAHTVIVAHARTAGKVKLDDQFVMMTHAFKASARALHVDLLVEDGTIIDLGGISLRVVYTPGHSSGCICLYEPKRRALFTGDTVFAQGTLGGIYSSGNISDYISSLERLREFNLNSLYPGHGRMSSTPELDLERAIHGSGLLMEDTKKLFDSLSTGTSFKQIIQATATYSRHAAERRRGKRRSCTVEALALADDGDRPVQLTEISPFGARTDCDIPGEAGATLTLAIEAAVNVECRIVARIGKITRLEFLPTADNREVLAEWLRTLAD